VVVGGGLIFDEVRSSLANCVVIQVTEIFKVNYFGIIVLLKELVKLNANTSIYFPSLKSFYYFRQV
jgi:hypothetical protein